MICTVADCGKPIIARGWCHTHYKRWQTHGTTDLLPRPTIEERFWPNVDKRGEGGCWLWTASKASGYGVIRHEGRQQLSHRVSYALLVGPVPPGLELDHLCRVPACVNPEHLEPVTPAENKRRGVGFGGLNARKTHCPRGHEYTPENTMLAGRARCRRCRICDRGKKRRESRLRTERKRALRRMEAA